MRLFSFLSSLLVVLSFALPWFRFNGGEITFLGILREVLTMPGGFNGAFWWLNPNSTAGMFTFIAFFAGIFMILVGVLFGVLGGRVGPGVGTVGVLVFTLTSWYVYGSGYFEVLAEGYIIALLSFVVGFVVAGGEKL
ncbi:amino acid permease [Thermococcus thermotolerans]|uniref:amino acid permease n=1 Tax=Thermococcus thermotolerans TaxID=2969672 RepID=UPI0021579D05|nr:amino acid permease [Thermococcus thermotolerans]